MAFITFKIPFNFRVALFSLLTASWVSGVVFYILHRWFVIEGEFGPEKHSWQQPVLMIHGASAFLMMICYGALLFAHVPSSWKLNRLRYLGISLVVAFAFQIITAYLLYYLSNEDVREIVANMHAFNGLLIPFLLTTHIVVGIRSGVRYKKEKIMND